jgi:hypothetical protein
MSLSPISNEPIENAERASENSLPVADEEAPNGSSPVPGAGGEDLVQRPQVVARSSLMALSVRMI